jgi:uncharacterized membrane protein
VTGDELRGQHFVQRPGLRARGAVVQAAQSRRRGQLVVAAHGGLHQHVAAQRLVVVQVFVAAAQAVDALREHLAQAVHDARRLARVGQHRCRRTAQSDVPIDLAQ